MSTNRRLLTGLVANFVGQGISAVASFAFIPAYIAILGIESYGLIGVFAVVLTAASLFDAGMTPTLNREMASFHVGKREASAMSDLLFSVLLVCGVALLATCLIAVVVTPWLARSWLPPSALPQTVVVRALLLMMVVATLRIIEGMLRGVLLGLHRPILMNGISSTVVIVRAAGVLLPLAFWPTVTTFFLWQAGVSIIGITVLVTVAFRAIGVERRPRFDGAALKRLREFAGGVFATSLIALILSQADKIILVKLTSLENFGYYAVAVAVSAVLYQGVLPISQSYYPHFTIKFNEGNEAQLRQFYHQASQLVAVIVFSTASFVVVFAPVLLLLWSGKSDVALNAGSLLQVLIIGSLFHCLMYIPYMLQLAANWSRLAVGINSVIACIYLPVLWFAASRYGALGAAVAWSANNFVALTVTGIMMHRRILPGEWGTWIRQDVAPSAIACTATAILFRALLPLPSSIVPRLAILALAGVAILIAGALAAPMGRMLLRRGVSRWGIGRNVASR